MATIEYLKCPLCNMNRVRQHPKVQPDNTIVEVTRWFRFYPDTEVIQMRTGGGRGSGFKLEEGAGATIEDLPRRDPELFRNLLEQVRNLHAALQEVAGKG